MKNKRGFAVVERFAGKINLPQRATLHSAGYDFEAAEDTLIPTIWQKGVAQVLQALLKKGSPSAEKGDSQLLKPTLVSTGIKAYMAEDEYLQLTNRSSNPIKRFLILPNGVGIVDSDYYNNPKNEGEIFFQFINFGLRDLEIKKGERIGQGIFLSFLKADNDKTTALRTGGFGSSGKESLKE